MTTTSGIDHAALHAAMLSQDSDDVIAIARAPILERLRKLAGDPDKLMAMWRTVAGEEEYLIPRWLPGLFVQAVTGEITRDTP